MILLLATISALLIVGCSTPIEHEDTKSTLPSANISIGDLRGYISPSSSVTINDDVIVVGRITSSDREGNFYKQIAIEDDTGGLVLLVDLYNTHREYPEGVELALRLKGCAAQYNYGTLEVGRADKRYGVDYLQSQVRIDEVVVRGTSIAKRQATPRQINELKGSMCGELTRIERLQLVASTSIDTTTGEILSDARWREYATFVDERSDTIVVYTSEYATYAERKIPNTEVAIEGILQQIKHPNTREYYSLKMRYESDCQRH